MAVCQIEFMPNEEAPDGECWSSMASACRSSMDVRMLPYLETFAENRAFSRCVKRALQINILADIEIGGDGRDAANTDTQSAAQSGETQDKPAPASGYEPLHVLTDTCKAQGVTFASLKAAAIKLNTDTPASKANERVQADPVTWNDFGDIQAIDAWLLIGKLKEAKTTKATKKVSP